MAVDNDKFKQAQNFVARDYQIDLLEKAIERNIIVYLGTGTGKTFVSVLLIKELLYQTQPAGGNKKTVFCAPSVALVKQQAAVIEKFVDADVGCYCGSSDIDMWDESKWRSEIAKNQILVLTPAIFVNILSANCMSLMDVNLMIFDECHGAVGDSCYMQVMQHHYLPTPADKRPRILGLTASVLNRKVKPSSVKAEIVDFCRRLDSTLATSTAAATFGTKPKEIVVLYKETAKLSLLAEPLSNGGGVTQFLENGLSEVGYVVSQMDNLLKDIGPYGALKSLQRRLKSTEHLLDNGLAEKTRLEKLRKLCLDIKFAERRLLRIIELIREKQIQNPYKVFLPHVGSTGEPVDEIELSVSPKVERLLELLESFEQRGRSLCCVIFAKEKCTVFALWCVLTALSRKCSERFGFIRPGFMMGVASSQYASEEDKILKFSEDRYQDEGSALENFRTGIFNVMVATSVIEEGVDIPQCNLIVKMSDSLDFRSYVQCRGRARAKPSIYAILTPERKAAAVETEIHSFQITEQYITEFCQQHDTDLIISDDVEFALAGDPDLPTLFAFQDDPLNSAIITAQSARQKVQWYCDSLGTDRYQVLRPLITYEKRVAALVTDTVVRCKILLPKLSKLYPEEIAGNWLQNQTKARISAALTVCKRLYEINELTTSLVPRKRPRLDTYVWTDDQMPNDVKELFDGHTITKKSTITCRRKMSDQLASAKHPILPAKGTIYVFRARLETPLNDDYSHMRTFVPEQEELCYGLLVFAPNCPSNIPDFPIFTRNGREAIHVETLTDVTVTQQIWTMCVEFRAYVLQKVCRITNFNCDASLAPAIVPVKSGAIDSRLLAAVTLKRQPTLELNSVVSQPIEGSVMSFFVRDIFNTDEGRKISLEKIPRNLDCVKEVFVDKTKLREVTSAATRLAHARPVTEFEVEFLSAAQWSKALTIPVCVHRLNRLLIAEHYRQQLVQAGVGHNGQPWPPMVEDRAEKLDRTAPKLASADLKFIRDVGNSPGPSPTDILTALSPLSAQELVDSERFELLGDSFLKMAVTLHLFSKNELSDEGILTIERCRLISNMNLLALAVPKGLHEAVESRKFVARETFRPPGFVATDEQKNKIEFQKYKSKICADSVEALIGVYLEKSGPIGALEFLRYLGLELGHKHDGPFLSRFNLSYEPAVVEDEALMAATFVKHSHSLDRVEKILGYKFRNPLYLLEAITHQSYRYNRVTRSYERLEFLGDAVIDYLVSSYIFTNNPHLNPGQMTLVRSALVCNDQFARIVTATNIAKSLQHYSPVLFRAMAKYNEVIERGLASDSLICEDETDDGDLVDVPKPFGDLMESIIGAVFIDSGLDFSRTWDLFRNLITDQVLIDTLNHKPRNPISELQENFPGKCVFGQAVVRDDGRIEMTLDVQGRSFTTASRNKKTAKLALAKLALRAFAEAPGNNDCPLDVTELIVKELNLG